MSRMWWIIVLVAAGVGMAVVIGILGTRNEPSGPSKPEALSSLCTSLESLGTSLGNLTSLSSSSSKSELDADLTAVQDDWNQVTSDVQAVQNTPSGELDSAWDSFTSAVKNIPSSSSVSDAVSSVTQAADQLVTAVQSTAAQVDCSSPAATTTPSG